jgi:hypothetical protein
MSTVAINSLSFRAKSSNLLFADVTAKAAIDSARVPYPSRVLCGQDGDFDSWQQIQNLVSEEERCDRIGFWDLIANS